MTTAPLDQIAGFANLRDVAGYRVGSTTVRPHALLRSDAPSSLDDAAATALRDVGLVAVIDLRDEREQQTAPSQFADHGFTVSHLPIFDSSAHALVQPEIGLTQLYRHMVEGCATTLTAAVRSVATAAPGAVLVHCTAGKDRTGITVALALRAIGVSRDDVVANYVQTEARLRGPWLDAQMVRLVAFLGDERAHEFVDLLVGSPAEAIETALDAVEQGSSERTLPYLRAHGMTDDELKALEARLLG
ncbi:protein-tyrosine phosphatase [Flavimobilis soli]|uniref:Protein-tyrosine phosphatase n=1 Tax=Flavimobilis soli TaxID=442709 RepID=A0A2A9EEL8_9MICO|nr:tyrosine-protein phosphatase [Flavimobilis soli]PFG36660.1 protein-tyrosine phosphatase [Flavimobilis soli]